MAEIVTDAEWSTSRSSFYPWDEWLDGQTRKLVRDVDFRVTCDSFRRNAYIAAGQRGMKIKTRLFSDQGSEAILFQAIKEEE